MTPYRVYRIVVACAVLHNICISLGEPEKEEEPDQEDIQPQQPAGTDQGQHDGRGIRDYVTLIIIYMWNGIYRPCLNRSRPTTNHVTIISHRLSLS